MSDISRLKEEIEKYTPFNEEEEKDKALILKFIDEPDILTRENTLAHLTASAWVVNKERTKVIMCYHKIYDSWSWLGGHADGEADLLSVAIKEVKEECGVNTVTPVSKEIFSLESLTVDGHYKHDEYVSSHLHLNITYLLEADENEILSVNEDENTGVKWFTLDEALKASTEPWFVEHVYKKLNQKLTASQP